MKGTTSTSSTSYIGTVTSTTALNNAASFNAVDGAKFPV
jgi:hypothetical protein